MSYRPRSGDGFRWTCPVCGETQLNTSSVDGEGRVNATNALRAHLIATEGDGHGPRNEYPSDFDPESIPKHITREDRYGV